MKDVIIGKQKEQSVVYLDDLSTETPIFVKEGGKLVGMIIKEDYGWIIRIGGSGGAYGYSSTQKECMTLGNEYTYHFES